MADSNVVTSTPDSEVHGEHYSATADDRGEVHGPWTSVDACSGELAAGNWANPVSRFPDTGRWQQT